MSFKRPSIPKVSRSVPKPKKTLRRLKSLPAKPTRNPKRPPPNTELKHPKKKKTVHLGTCYSELDCTGNIISRKVTKTWCKSNGGKSWHGSTGCKNVK